MSYQDVINAALRLDILRALECDAGYAHNEYVLRELLRCVGHDVSADRLRVDLAWLAEQGLITLVSQGDIQVARLNDRGQDVAAGRAQIPGVARPGPGQ
ncbi:MAG: ArsR family transcriptional regulator [Pseudomonadales bacterium]|nr:ArsR family transcriptional regulator [Pseudomonadales bacterium]